MGNTRRGQQWRCHGHRGGGANQFGWRVLLAAVVLGVFGAAVLIPPPLVGAEEGAVVEVSSLSLRAEPGDWSADVGELRHGDWTEVLAGPTWDGWYQLRAGDLIGWGPGASLSIDSAGGGNEVAIGGADLGTTAWVITDAVNVRLAPSIDASVTDVIQQGSTLTVSGEAVDGYVPINQGTGWVQAQFLSFSGPPVSADATRWVDIDRSNQQVTLYEGTDPVATYWGAMGRDQSDSGFFATAIGTYYVYEKYQDLSWTVWGRAWVTDWVGFDPVRINGFHSYSMDASGQVIPGGAGPTGGCIALAPEAADHLFAFVSIGSRVEVHW